MATGIHSRLQSGRTAVKTPPAGSWLKRAWDSLSPKKRMALFATLLVLVGSALMLSQIRAANEPSELYPFAIAPVELRDMARELLIVGIPHDINSEQNNLLVAPAQQERARQALRDRRLPRARPEHKKRQASTMSPETEAERLADLQESIRVDLRQLEGVADASVLIAMPPPSYGMGDQPPTTASVKIEMQLGRHLSSQQVAGITAMISASVTGLEPEHVQVVDQTGRILTRQSESLQQDLMTSLQASLELSLTQKAQSLLDRCLGPGHGHVGLTVELDTSEIEIRKKTSDPNSYVVLQRRTEKEEYGTGMDLGEPMSGGGSPSKNYRKICEITKGEADQSYFVKVDRQPRIARLSCAVGLDRAAEAERVRELIKGAIGLDETRGDFITVQTITPPLAATDSLGSDSSVVPAEKPSQLSWMALGAGFLLAGLAALLAAGMTPRRFRPQLEMSERSTLLGIQDLRETRLDHETSIRQTQRVEEYVRQVPNRAAATLKELWLQ